MMCHSFPVLYMRMHIMIFSNLQVIKATRKHAEPLAGSISYETLDDTKFIPYSERDISGEFTLFVGEWIQKFKLLGG